MPERDGQLDRHLRTDFDHAAGGDLEEVRGVAGALGEADEQPVLPHRHARLRRGLQRTA